MIIVVKVFVEENIQMSAAYLEMYQKGATRRGAAKGLQI